MYILFHNFIHLIWFLEHMWDLFRVYNFALHLVYSICLLILLFCSSFGDLNLTLWKLCQKFVFYFLVYLMTLPQLHK